MTIKEVFTTLVIEGGLSPDYVLDKMLMYELEPLISNIHKKNKDSWEQTRLLAYITALVNSTKKLKPSDIISFCWDEDSTGNTAISNEDIERLKNKAKQYVNK